MSGEDIAILRSDIHELQKVVELHGTDIAVMKASMELDHESRKERQEGLDTRLDTMEDGIGRLLQRNERIDGTFDNVRKTAVWISSVTGGFVAVGILLKFIIKGF